MPITVLTRRPALRYYCKDGGGKPVPMGSSSLAGLRIGVVTNYVNEGVETIVARAIERALGRLSAAGAIVSSLVVPEFDMIPEMTAHGGFSAAEAFAFYREELATAADRIDPRVLARLEVGGCMLASDYLQLQTNRRALVKSVQFRFVDLDVVAMPTIPIIAPTFARVADDEHYHAINALVLRNPTTVNLIDGCAISLPVHTPGEAPVGLAFAAAGGNDTSLLRAAVAAEHALLTA